MLVHDELGDAGEDSISERSSSSILQGLLCHHMLQKMVSMCGERERETGRVGRREIREKGTKGERKCEYCIKKLLRGQKVNTVY